MRAAWLALTLLVRPAAAAPVDAGPHAISAPAGARFAEDGADLVRLLAEGPAEIWLRPTTYRGPFDIRRAVAVRGLPGATIDGTVRIEADGATLDNVIVRAADLGVRAKGKGNTVRNIRVDGAVAGISFEACHRCLLEGSFVRGPVLHESLRGDGIKLWEAHDSIVRGNHVERVRDVVVWYSQRVVCEDNVVKDSRYGTHFMYAHDSVARRSTLRDNVVGIFVMYSSRLRVEHNVLAGAHGAAGVGLGFKESDGVVVTGNHIVGNTNGAYLDRTPRDPREPVTFTGNVLGVNDLALRVHGAAKGITFTKNAFKHNGELIEVDGGNDARALEFIGNYWSDYAGYDLDGDGVGDVAFTHGRLSTAVVADNPNVRFLHGTVAMQLVDAVAKAFPLLERQPVLVDPRPAMGGIP